MQSNPRTALRVVSAILPQSSSATVTSTGFSTSGFTTAYVILALGTMAANATCDVKVTQCATLGGTYADITGAAFAQKVAATHAGLVFVGELDLRDKLGFLKIVAAQATAASLVSVIVVLCGPDRTERVFAAQAASEAVAAPLTSTAHGFSV